MPRLIFLSGPELGKEVSLGHNSILGRDSGCTLHLADASVSRQHAQIQLREGKYYLKDLASSNGTFLNEKKIVESELAPGDEIRLGKFSLRFAAETENGDAGFEEIVLPGSESPAASQSSAPAVPAAQTPRRKLPDFQSIQAPKLKDKSESLLSQDFSQYGPVYKLGMLLVVLVIAAAAFWGFRYLSSKAVSSIQEKKSAQEGK